MSKANKKLQAEISNGLKQVEEVSTHAHQTQSKAATATAT